jgi:hypothetical protein
MPTKTLIKENVSAITIPVEWPATMLYVPPCSSVPGSF